jgi:flagellin-like protein
MNEQITKDRAQVGIGTLIVFIALVLVAAIAAGVLINTAGLLQNQAESTGQESTEQVSSGLEVVSASVGVDSSSPPSPNAAPELTLQLSAGSDPVDLAELRIDVAGDTGGVTSLISGDGYTTSSGVLEDGSEFGTITLSAFNSGNSNLLDAGDEVQLTITTADGSQTTEIIKVPDPIEGTGEIQI